MSYKLQKPYTEEQRLDFIVEYSHSQCLLIEETETALYALEANEIIQDGKVIINPNYSVELAQEEKAIRILEIKSQLQVLDAQAIRPLRAILTDCGTDEDREILQSIETQAGTLREELSQLEQ